MNTDDKTAARLNMAAGKHQAMRIAFLTLVRCLPADARAEFELAYPLNVETVRGNAISFPLADEWLQALEDEAASLVRSLAQGTL